MQALCVQLSLCLGVSFLLCNPSLLCPGPLRGRSSLLGFLAEAFILQPAFPELSLLDRSRLEIRGYRKLCPDRGADAGALAADLGLPRLVSFNLLLDKRQATGLGVGVLEEETQIRRPRLAGGRELGWLAAICLSSS